MTQGCHHANMLWYHHETMQSNAMMQRMLYAIECNNAMMRCSEETYPWHSLRGDVAHSCLREVPRRRFASQSFNVLISKKVNDCNLQSNILRTDSDSVPTCWCGHAWTQQIDGAWRSTGCHQRKDPMGPKSPRVPAEVEMQTCEHDNLQHRATCFNITSRPTCAPSSFSKARKGDAV